MANEALWKTTSQITVQSSGASMASNAGKVSAGTIATSQHSNYPYLDFVLSGSIPASQSIASGSMVALYARGLNVDGTKDNPVPGASYANKLVGIFPMPGLASSADAQEITVSCEDVPSSPLGDVEYYVENLTNQTISAGWTLKATPKTLVPGS